MFISNIDMQNVDLHPIQVRKVTLVNMPRRINLQAAIYLQQSQNSEALALFLKTRKTEKIGRWKN